MSEKSFRFTHAITRKPSRSIVDGLRAEDTGTPDLQVFQTHHNDYCPTFGGLLHPQPPDRRFLMEVAGNYQDGVTRT